MKKTYFASDFHLGIDTSWPSKEREKLAIQWLTSIQSSADEIYLLGDVFDYWFEYQEVVPKGFVRLLGKIAELVDSGINVHWLTGNHDMWTFGYLESEIGVRIYKRPIMVNIYGLNVYLAHGDGLGKGDNRYKLTKWVLSNRFCQKLFSLVPSRVGLWLMKRSSHGSRFGQMKDESLEVQQDDSLIEYSALTWKKDISLSYFVYGHRHRPQILKIPDTSAQYVNLGDWTHHFTYGVLDDTGVFKLEKFIIPS